MDLRSALATLNRTLKGFGVPVDEYGVTEYIAMIGVIAKQTGAKAYEGDPKNWTIKQIQEFTRTVKRWKAGETPGGPEKPITPAKKPKTPPRTHPPQGSMEVATSQRTEGFPTFGGGGQLPAPKTGPGKIFEQLTQPQFGKSFGGGHDLDQTVNPQAERMQMAASASGASMPQMDYQQHPAHVSSHKPRADKYNHLMSNPEQSRGKVYAAGSPFVGGDLPPAVPGLWAAPAPPLESSGGDTRQQNVTERTNDWQHPQSGIGGSAERDAIMRQKTKPINLSGLTDEAYGQARVQEQRQKAQRERTVQQAMMGATLEGSATIDVPSDVADPPLGGGGRRHEGVVDMGGEANIPTGISHPVQQSGRVSPRRARELKRYAAEKPINVRDTSAISLRDEPEETPTPTMPLPKLDEFADLTATPGKRRRAPDKVKTEIPPSPSQERDQKRIQEAVEGGTRGETAMDVDTEEFKAPKPTGGFQKFAPAPKEEPGRDLKLEQLQQKKVEHDARESKRLKKEADFNSRWDNYFSKYGHLNLDQKELHMRRSNWHYPPDNALLAREQPKVYPPPRPPRRDKTEQSGWEEGWAQWMEYARRNYKDADLDAIYRIKSEGRSPPEGDSYPRLHYGMKAEHAQTALDQLTIGPTGVQQTAKAPHQTEPIYQTEADDRHDEKLDQTPTDRPRVSLKSERQQKSGRPQKSEQHDERPRETTRGKTAGYKAKYYKPRMGLRGGGPRDSGDSDPEDSSSDYRGGGGRNPLRGGGGGPMRRLRAIERGGQHMAAEQARMQDLLQRMHQQQMVPPPAAPPQIIQQPHQGIINYPVPVPSLALSAAGVSKVRDDVPKIYIKNIAKAVANERKVRFKKTTAPKVKKQQLRKRYTTLKTETRKRIKAGKKAHYTRENDRIKKLPVKQRKAARAKLKAELSKREKTLLKSLPAASKMKVADLRKLISRTKQLKW